MKVHDSTGNVFQDMGMRDAEERLAKAELARLIRAEIRQRELTQAQAAEFLGIQQPDVSDLVRGKLSRFSMSRLERFLNALDLEIRIQVGPRPTGEGSGRHYRRNRRIFLIRSPSPSGRRSS